MYELSKRTSNFSDSVIRRMTRIANKYDAVNLSQGFPDFAPPKEITDNSSACAAKQEPAVNSANKVRVAFIDIILV